MTDDRHVPCARCLKMPASSGRIGIAGSNRRGDACRRRRRTGRQLGQRDNAAKRLAPARKGAAAPADATARRVVPPPFAMRPGATPGSSRAAPPPFALSSAAAGSRAARAPGSAGRGPLTRRRRSYAAGTERVGRPPPAAPRARVAPLPTIRATPRPTPDPRPCGERLLGATCREFPGTGVDAAGSTGMPDIERTMPLMPDPEEGASPGGDRVLVGFADPSHLAGSRPSRVTAPRASALRAVTP